MSNMTKEMKAFLTELAELLEKHDMQIEAGVYSIEFSYKRSDGIWLFFMPEFSDITHENIKELLE